MRLIYAFFFLCLFQQVSFSQNRMISGTIKDSQTGEVLPYVTVLEKGTTNGVSTGLDGYYTILVNDTSATLVFSYIGYGEVEKKIVDESKIHVLLDPQSESLGEILVTALNLKRSSKKLGYSIQKLDAKEISEVKSSNFIDNLSGRIAGATITQGASGVGSTTKISIRGEASFTNNNPLFVVDGTPISNNTQFNFTSEAAAGFQEVDFGNGAMEVNSDDIASLIVLKGPSAAALYGTRASNGVILINTKNGTKKKGIGVSFNSSFFVDSPFQLPEFQNSYGQGNSGEFEFVDGLGAGTNDNITYSWGPALNQGILIPQFDSPVTLSDGSVVRGGDVAIHGGATIPATPFNAQDGNLDNFYDTGFTSINNLSMSTGFEKGDLRFSLTDLQSESYIPGVNLNRRNAAVKLNFNPSSKLKVTTSINYANSKSDNRPSSGYGSENINYSLVAWGPRSLNIENLKDYWQPGLEELQQFSFNYTFFDNPYFILLENKNTLNRDRLFSNISATYSLTDELSLNVSSGMDYADELRTFSRHFSTNRFRSGAYAEQDLSYLEVNTNFLLSYARQISDFQTEISLGGNRMNQETKNKQTQALSLAQAGIFNFSNAASPVEVFQFNGEKRINSLYALFKVGYKNLLFIDVTGRNDWSSSLASPNSTLNTSFFYPSVSTSYILSNGIMLPQIISFAKLRASWAQVGNDTDPYQTSGAFIAGTAYNSQPTFTAQNIIAKEDLLPEKTTAIEFGADIRILDDRFRFDLSYYNALTENQIISFPVAQSSGFNQQVVNGGAVRTKGFELMAGVNLIRKKNFQWNCFINFSTNKSTVEELPEGTDKITLAFSRVYDNVNQTVWFQVGEGGEIGDMYGTGYLKNEEGEFILTEEGNYIADNNLIKLGNYNPDFVVGFNNSFSYKNWDLNFLIDWRQGGQIISRTLALAAVGGQLLETENRPEEGIVAAGVVNVGTTENPQWEQNTTAISPESYYRQFHDRNHEENNRYNASFAKLRQFSISYRFTADKEKGILKEGRELSIGLIGRNIFAISNIPHFDPEQFSVQGNQIVSGVEDMSYPSARSFGFKLGYNF